MTEKRSKAKKKSPKPTERASRKVKPDALARAQAEVDETKVTSRAKSTLDDLRPAAADMVRGMREFLGPLPPPERFTTPVVDGYPVHEKCGGLLMSAEMAAMKPLDGHAACGLCTPRTGALVKVGAATMAAVSAACSRVVVAQSASAPDREIIMADLRRAERRALAMYANPEHGTPGKRAPRGIGRLISLGLVTSSKADRRITALGARVAASGCVTVTLPIALEPAKVAS